MKVLSGWNIYEMVHLCSTVINIRMTGNIQILSQTINLKWATIDML